MQMGSLQVLRHRAELIVGAQPCYLVIQVCELCTDSVFSRRDCMIGNTPRSHDGKEVINGERLRTLHRFLSLLVERT